MKIKYFVAHIQKMLLALVFLASGFSFMGEAFGAPSAISTNEIKTMSQDMKKVKADIENLSGMMSKGKGTVNDEMSSMCKQICADVGMMCKKMCTMMDGNMGSGAMSQEMSMMCEQLCAMCEQMCAMCQKMCMMSKMGMETMHGACEEACRACQKMCSYLPTKSEKVEASLKNMESMLKNMESMLKKMK